MKLGEFFKKRESDENLDSSKVPVQSLTPPISPISPDDKLAPTMQRIMGYAEILGIDKKQIGNTLLKAAITGKFDFKETQTRRNPFEKVMQTIYDGWFLWLLFFFMYVILLYLNHIWK